MSVDRRELLERYGRVYGELGLALAFTTVIDPAKGDPKAVIGSWDKTKPLRSAVQGERLMGLGMTGNPVVVLRPSGLIGIESDTAEGLARIEALELPETVTVRSSEPWKRHYWFRPPNGSAPQYVAFRFEEAGVSADTGRYFLCPPALHPSGVLYEFLASPEDVEITALPEDRYQELVRVYKETESAEREQLQVDPEAKIKPGSRRKMIFRYACQQRRWTASEEEIVELALVWNGNHCDPPLTEEQVRYQVAGAMKKTGGQELAAATARAEAKEGATTLPEVVSAFSRWLHLPDPGALYAVLGAVAANRLEGDPVWLLLVGPPGSGKSELLSALFTVPDIHPAATLTEAALLSGTPKREKATDAKGGLLRSIGDFGIIAAKDFGSVLSMNRDARAAVLAALREVYDGSWTRHVGTDGGRTLAWSGKVGLVAGCTPTIDRHHAVMGAMGERFVIYRLPGASSDEQASRALAHAGHEKRMRAELAAAVVGLFSGELRTPRDRDEEETERLKSLATLTVVCRSAVERDGYSREIELIPAPEAPTRLVIVLDRLLAGLDAIGVERAAAWKVVRKAALDSIPATRLSVLEVLFVGEGLTETAAIAEELGYPTNTTRRVLEDLTAHGVVRRVKSGEGEKNVDRWKLTEWAETQYRVCVPEMSEGAHSLYTSRSACSTTFRERQSEDA